MKHIVEIELLTHVDVRGKLHNYIKLCDKLILINEKKI